MKYQNYDQTGICYDKEINTYMTDQEKSFRIHQIIVQSRKVETEGLFIQDIT